MNATFSSRLKEIRESRNMTQDDLAEKIGTNRVTISRYEAGTVQPSGARVAEMASVLGVTIDYLMKGETSKEQEEQDEVWILRDRMRNDPDYRILFKAAQKATPEHLRAAAAVLNALDDDTEDKL